MKNIAIVLMFLFGFTIVADSSNLTNEDAIAIVENAVAGIKVESAKTLKEIIEGKPQYWSKENRFFFVFVMDENVKIVACPILRYMNRYYQGVKDVEGKTYRDETVTNALKNKEGWTSFSIKSRGKIVKKKTYFKLVKGDDNKHYIVCCDIDIKSGEGE